MVEIKKRGCKFFIFDLVQGGLEKIIQATTFFRFLVFIKLDGYCLPKKKLSYKTELVKYKIKK